MSRLRFVAPMLVFGLLSSGFLMGEDPKTDKDPIIVKAQLPRYYRQLGLSDKQKKTIYKIHGQYALQLEKLQREIAALKAKEKDEVENVLTEAQKARLKELQPGGSTKEPEIKDKPTEVKKK